MEILGFISSLCPGAECYWSAVSLLSHATDTMITSGGRKRKMFVSMQLSSHQISFLIIKLFNQCTDNIKLMFFVHKILSFANIKIFLIGIIFPYQLEALHRKCWRIRQTEIFHILVRVKSFGFMVRGKAQQCTIFGSISGYQIFVT